jgi:hypothetical protein
MNEIRTKKVNMQIKDTDTSTKCTYLLTPPTADSGTVRCRSSPKGRHR